MPHVTGLFHYPIKGLSAQPVPRVVVTAGNPFPFDRVFALARPGAGIDPAAPAWAKKGRFVMLMLDEGLARVRTNFDHETLRLTARDGAATVLSADLGTPNGQRATETFIHGLAPALPAPPMLVRARDGHFMDKPDNVISLINLATVRDLEARLGVAIDPLRFRANIYIDGAAPWTEFDWIGAELRLGAAVFAVDRRNGRCGATNVDPATGRRDLDLPGSLRKAFGHKDCGIYLIARNDAALAVGDTVSPPRETAPAPVPPPEPATIARRALLCRGCYFVYEETPAAPFAALADDWRCPDCGTGKATFRPVPS